jgi:heme exporter protein CcmD
MSIDWQAFWAMGGHGMYVWWGYGGAALLVAIEACAVWRRLQRRKGRT